MGEKLLRHCLSVAKEQGYKSCYLETLSGMDAAMRLYEKVGFKKLCAPMCATVYAVCER